jgi:hypothetical protein
LLSAPFDAAMTNREPTVGGTRHVDRIDRANAESTTPGSASRPHFLCQREIAIPEVNNEANGLSRGELGRAEGLRLSQATNQALVLSFLVDGHDTHDGAGVGVPVDANEDSAAPRP